MELFALIRQKSDLSIALWIEIQLMVLVSSKIVLPLLKTLRLLGTE